MIGIGQDVYAAEPLQMMMDPGSLHPNIGKAWRLQPDNLPVDPSRRHFCILTQPSLEQ